MGTDIARRGNDEQQITNRFLHTSQSCGEKTCDKKKIRESCGEKRVTRKRLVKVAGVFRLPRMARRSARNVHGPTRASRKI